MKNQCQKITAAQVDKIVADYVSGKSIREVAALNGVSRTSVHKYTTRNGVVRSEQAGKNLCAEQTAARKAAVRKTEELLWSIGHPTMYRAEFCQQILDYFDIEPYRVVTRVNQKTGNEYDTKIPNDLPTFCGFARQIGVSLTTVRRWKTVHPDFAAAASQCRTITEHLMVTNMLAGLYDPKCAQLIALNYTDLRNIKEHRDVTPEIPPDTPEEIQQRIDALDERIETLKAAL